MVDAEWLDDNLNKLLGFLIVSHATLFVMNKILQAFRPAAEEKKEDNDLSEDQKEMKENVKTKLDKLKGWQESDCAQYVHAQCSEQAEHGELFLSKEVETFQRMGQFVVEQCGGKWPQCCLGSYDGPFKVPIVTDKFTDHFLTYGLMNTEEKFEWIDVIEDAQREDEVDEERVVDLPYKDADGKVVFVTGSGTFGIVAETKNEKSTIFSRIKNLVQRAFPRYFSPTVDKQIKVKNISEMNAVLREIQILSVMQHPHVCKYLKSWIVREELPPTPDIDDTPTLLFDMGHAEESVGSENIECEALPEEQFDFLKFDYSVHIRMEFYSMTLHKMIEEQIQTSRLFMTSPEAKELMFANYRQIWSRLASELFAAIFYIHQKNIIHRDIKPENIFIKAIANFSTMSVVLGDFGISRKTSRPEQNEIELLTMGMGTYSYAAPEQLTSSRYDKLVDVFSGGLVVYEMISQFKKVEQRNANFQYIRANGDFPLEFQEIYPEFYDCLSGTVSLDSQKRPSATEVYMKLAILYTNENYNWWHRMGTDKAFCARTAKILSANAGKVNKIMDTVS